MVELGDGEDEDTDYDPDDDEIDPIPPFNVDDSDEESDIISYC